MTPMPHRLPALVATLATLAGTLLAAPQAAAQERRNEFGLHWTPAALASDERRSRGIAYDRDFGNGWSLGGTIGYGRVEAPQDGDGAYGVLRLRKRFSALPAMPSVSPQIGLEYGGTTDIWNTSEIVGVIAGVHIAASPELGFTIDGWFGKLRFESGSLVGPTEQTRRDSVQNIRLGLVFRY